jgi:Ni/Co efflux regulator RcnB
LSELAGCFESRTDKDCAWDNNWGNEPDDTNWCREGGTILQANQNILPSKKIGQISGLARDFCLIKFLSKMMSQRHIHIPYAHQRHGQTVNTYWRHRSFEVRDETELNLDLESIILNAYLSGNDKLIPYTPPTSVALLPEQQRQSSQNRAKESGPLFQDKSKC